MNLNGKPHRAWPSPVDPTEADYGAPCSASRWHLPTAHEHGGGRRGQFLAGGWATITACVASMTEPNVLLFARVVAFAHDRSWQCAPKARTISGGGFHPDSCRGCAWANRLAGRSPKHNARRQPSRGGTSRISREAYVRFCEGLGVKVLGPTRPQEECRRTAWRVSEQGYMHRAEVVGGPGQGDTRYGSS